MRLLPSLTFWTLLSLCGVLHSPLGGAAQQRYVIEEIVPLAGQTTTRAAGLNELGQVVGTSDGSPFLWEAGFTTEIRTPWGSASAVAINDRGLVIGGYTDASTGASRAFGYQHGQTPRDLGVLPGAGVEYAIATALNNRGQIVGISRSQAFLFDDGKMTSLAPTDPFSYALGINEQSAIVGNLGGTVFLYEAGVLQRLGGLPGFVSTGLCFCALGTGAVDINDLGQFIGAGFYAASTTSINHAYLWENGTWNDFVLTSGFSTDVFLRAINNRGQIVGVDYGKSKDGLAVIFDPSTGLTDLNTLISPNSGWTLETANDINDRGQIVGVGILNGSIRGFMLSPVPEPTMALTIASGLLLLVLRAQVAGSRVVGTLRRIGVGR